MAAIRPSNRPFAAIANMCGVEFSQEAIALAAAAKLTVPRPRHTGCGILRSYAFDRGVAVRRQAEFILRVRHFRLALWGCTVTFALGLSCLRVLSGEHGISSGDP
ncbi:hypothetical protein, partial [Loktanella sp. IMCC34160]|uniref:hypothetical protein n=1 Tax=Loktanella sp. IMCC34160 TaxID=2510646 RepID=UPI001A928E82